MSKTSSFYFHKIVLYIALGTMLFTFLSCKGERTSASQTSSQGIAGEDFAPSWSPDGSKIVYCTDIHGRSEIYIMDADGSNKTRLTDNQVGDFSPSWSPDMQKILFASNRDGNSEIYVMDADGSNLTRLTNNPAFDGMSSWSPDGSRILLVSNRDGNSEIYAMDADGTDMTRLTDNSANDGMPSWSPDGTRILFVSTRDRNIEIYTMNADGSEPTRLTENPARDRSPSWSPDGNRIVFDSNRDGNREIYVMNADGSEQTNLTHSPSRDINPSFSPDGKKIIFETDRDFDEEIYVMDADGSDPINLTNNAQVNEAFGLAPLPRSELDLDAIPHKLVFQSLRETGGKENWEICMIDATGSNLINLTNTPDVDERFPHASPDGRRICFEAHEGEETKNRSRNVYYMNIDGTGKVKVADNAYQPCWSPDSRYLAYLPGEFPRYNPRPTANKGLEIYDLETKTVRRHPDEEIIHLRQLCWSPDGEWFTATGWGLFRVDDKTRMSLTMGGCTPDIGPEGKSLAWNGTDWSLNIGKLNVDSPLSTVTHHRMKVGCEREYWVYHADWSPDGKYIAFTYGFDDERKPAGERKPWSHICICDLESGKWTQITSDGKYNEQPDWAPVQEGK